MDTAVQVVRNADRIQPWGEDPRYWQYKGRPVLLLGGSETDHIFLYEPLKEHLDEMPEVGANYVRCTMSQREPKELKPYALRSDGTFDLDQWNDDYWERFQNMLRWTAEHEIFVQIEVWDRFDYSRDSWEISPWNPGQNVNWSYEDTGFAEVYPRHPHADDQPFFHTIPGMPLYDERLEQVRDRQERFVDRMLGFSLPYGHVLYCMNNETNTPAAWGRYWIDYIQQRASESDLLVFATDMFNDAWKGEEAVNTLNIFEDPDHYVFADISQVNSRNFDDQHWEQVLWLMSRVNEKRVRPCNNTKIYGRGYTAFGTGGPEDGVEKFWRDILAGCASARFHRPYHGNGLNDWARGSIRAARQVEERVRFWEVEPMMHLLSDRAENEAYLAARSGEKYVLYFTNGGSVKLDLSDAPGVFDVTWISVSIGEVVETTPSGGQPDPTVEGGETVEIAAPYKGGWVATLVRQS